MGKRFFKSNRAYKLSLFGLVAVLLLVLVMGIIHRENIERHFIYFPVLELEAAPSYFGLSFEDIYFMTEDGIRLHAWFVPGEKSPTWLWFHGNAGNISHRLENLALIHDQLGINIFLFDYRGYGNSQGSPSEKGIYLDGEAAIEYLHSRNDIRNNQIIYFGRSLGAAIAVKMAARHPPAGLILESAFPSIPHMVRHLYPFLPVWPFLGTRYDAISVIGQVQTPLLMLHGNKDTIVPLELGQKLFEAAKGDKSFYIIPGAGHNDTYLAGGENYFQELRRFVIKLERR